MKNFDLDQLSRKMPYKAPADDFFENFTEELLAKVAEPQPRKIFWLRSTIAPIIGVAALLAVVLTLSFGLQKESDWSYDYMLSDTIAQSVDSYFDSLSDEELAYLASESSYDDDFYYNLLDN